MSASPCLTGLNLGFAQDLCTAAEDDIMVSLYGSETIFNVTYDNIDKVILDIEQYN